MKLRIKLFTAFASMGLSASMAAAAPVAIHNVTIITMDGSKIVAGGSVIVDGSKIRSILATSEPLPKGIGTIDGKGGFLIPGLIDTHTHYPYYGVAKPAAYLRYGVTTLFSLGSRENELDALLNARKAIKSGEVIGPHIYATGPSVANHVQLETTEAVDPFLDTLQKQGFEFIKVYNETPRPVFDAIVAGAERRGMGVFGHMPRNFPPEYTLAHGLDVLVHAEELFFTTFQGPRDKALAELSPDWTADHTKVDPILDAMAKNNVVLIPNLNASFEFQNLWIDEDREFSVSDMKMINPEIRKDWREGNNTRRDQAPQRAIREQIKYPLIRLLTYRASKKGILLLAGSDAPLPGIFPGRSLHQELRLMVAAGLTAEEALATATKNGGMATSRYVDRKACIGVIRVKCDADFVLLGANPLEDIRNTSKISGVMADGRWYSPEELERLAAYSESGPGASR